MFSFFIDEFLLPKLSPRKTGAQDFNFAGSGLYMISSAPGIHRPSYNGAPAKQTQTLQTTKPGLAFCQVNLCDAPNSACVATYAGAFAASLTSAFDKEV